MIIALDYDNTYTVDPKLWARFVRDAKVNGHTVKIVTMRYPHEPIVGVPCEVVYTSRQAKVKTFRADVWIDDSPHWIYQDAI
jgi:hypothetical protein